MRDDFDYTADMLNDELWAELSLSDQQDIVVKARSLAERALNDIKADLQGETRRGMRELLLRKRARTITFIGLCTQRSTRIKAEQAAENIRRSETQAHLKHAHLREAIKAHKLVTDDENSTDEQIGAADARLYAALEWYPSERSEIIYAVEKAS